MQFISYKPYVEREIPGELKLDFEPPEFKNTVQHVFLFVVDEIAGNCRYFLKCNGPYTVRSMSNRIYYGMNGIYGTSVILYDLSQKNLDEWSKKLKTSFFQNREMIKRDAEEYRSKYPDSPSYYLNDPYVGRWK